MSISGTSDGSSIRSDGWKSRAASEEGQAAQCDGHQDGDVLPVARMTGKPPPPERKRTGHQGAVVDEDVGERDNNHGLETPDLWRKVILETFYHS